MENLQFFFITFNIAIFLLGGEAKGFFYESEYMFQGK